MEREQIEARMSRATSPNDIATAINTARDWLIEHPEDEDVRNRMQELIRAEREQLVFGR
jgi:hypothetical protein